MKSPFPGMDPFIEARGGLWKDFHDKLVMEIERTLAPQLPEHYVVRAGERSFVELVESGLPKRCLREPDVAIANLGSAPLASQAARLIEASDTAVAEFEPITLL